MRHGHDHSMGDDDMHGHLDEPNLLELAHRLDRLGRSDRAAAPADLESRLLTAVRPGQAAREPAPLRYVPAAEPGRDSRRFWTPLPLAAAVAVLATVGAVWLSGRGAGPATGHTELAALTLEQDVSQWLDLSDMIGSELDAELAAIDAEAARLSTNPDEASTGLETLLEEGAL